MKRSEMIKVIESILSCTDHPIEDHAECILATLEELGMNPPDRFVTEGNYSAYVCRWDLE